MEKKVRVIFDARVLIALLVIIVGILLLIENLGYDIGLNIWELWPLILVILGISMLAKPREIRQTLSGSILLLVGILFLLDTLDIVPYAIWDFWPVIVILVGILILKNAIWGTRRVPSSSQYVNLSFVLGGGDFKFNTDKFKGGRVTAVLGGGTIDLRQADIEEAEAVLDVFAFMGGIEVRVPHHWEVNLQGTPILGGIDNNTSLVRPDESSTAKGKSVKKLVVKGSVIMGGVEIKN